MNIRLLRYERGRHSIRGVLSVDNISFCDTLEDASRHLAEGDYSIVLRRCAVSNYTLPLVESSRGICRDCEKCAGIAAVNADIADRSLQEIENIIGEGRREGVPESVYTARALELERSMPPHADRLPMPFCPRLVTGNGACGSTDSSIVIGRSTDIPGLVIESRHKMDTLLKNIRRHISRGSRVTLTVVERYAAVLVLAVTLALTGCGTTGHASSVQETPVRTVRDSFTASDVRYDSIYIRNDRLQDRTGDTVYVHDLNVEYRYRLLHDTVRIVRRDSIPYPVRVTELREVPRRRGAFDYASYCCLAVVAGTALYRLVVRFRIPKL